MKSKQKGKRLGGKEKEDNHIFVKSIKYKPREKSKVNHDKHPKEKESQKINKRNACISDEEDRLNNIVIRSKRTVENSNIQVQTSWKSRDVKKNKIEPNIQNEANYNSNGEEKDKNVFNQEDKSKKSNQKEDNLGDSSNRRSNTRKVDPASSERYDKEKIPVKIQIEEIYKPNIKKRKGLNDILGVIFPQSWFKQEFQHSLQSNSTKDLFEKTLKEHRNSLKDKSRDINNLNKLCKALKIDPKSVGSKEKSLIDIGDYLGLKVINDFYPKMKIEAYEPYEFQNRKLVSKGRFKAVFTNENSKDEVVCEFIKIDKESMLTRTKELCIYLYFDIYSGIGKVKRLLVDKSLNLKGFIMPRYHCNIKTILNSKTFKLSKKFKFYLIYKIILQTHTLHKNEIAHNDLCEVNVLITERLLQFNNDEEHSDNIKVKDILNPFNLNKQDEVDCEPIILDFGKSMALNKEFIKNVKIGKNYIVSKENWHHLPLLELKDLENGHLLYRSTVKLHTSKMKKKIDIDDTTFYNPLKEDIYSLGILIYRILTNSMPWGGILENESIKLKELISDPEKQFKHLKEDLKDCFHWIFMLSSILHPNPDIRLGTGEIIRYFKRYGMDMFNELFNLNTIRNSRRR